MITEKNQGHLYDTSPYPQMEKGEDGAYHVVLPDYYSFSVKRGDPLTTDQYLDVLLSAVIGVPIDRIDITINTDQLDALKRKHGDQIAQFFTKL